MVCKIIFVIIWILFVVICLLMLYGFEIGYDKYGKWSCLLFLDEVFNIGVEKVYYNFIFIGLFVVFLLVMVIFYIVILIFLKLRKVFGEEVL